MTDDVDGSRRVGMFDLSGKVAFITGGARGQGRSHAVTLAKAGADVAVSDICGALGVCYPDASFEDLEETKLLVEKEGRKCLIARVDVRDPAALTAFANRAVNDLGSLDILAANAGILEFAAFSDLTSAQWQKMVDINLTGVFNSMKAVLPHMLAAGKGRIVATSSMAGRMGYGNIAHYTAAKWGVIGLVKDVAVELGQSGVTVNAICPTNVGTPMVLNPFTYQMFRPELTNPGPDDITDVMSAPHPQAVPWIEPQDVSAALLYLASDEARHVTGEVMTVSAGLSARNST
jgi:SDR family mycofactocin-dependent oxidoreductase